MGYLFACDTRKKSDRCRKTILDAEDDIAHVESATLSYHHLRTREGEALDDMVEPRVS